MSQKHDEIRLFVSQNPHMKKVDVADKFDISDRMLRKILSSGSGVPVPVPAEHFSSGSGSADDVTKLGHAIESVDELARWAVEENSDLELGHICTRVASELRRWLELEKIDAGE